MVLVLVVFEIVCYYYFVFKKCLYIYNGNSVKIAAIKLAFNHAYQLPL